MNTYRWCCLALGFLSLSALADGAFDRSAVSHLLDEDSVIFGGDRGQYYTYTPEDDAPTRWDVSRIPEAGLLTAMAKTPLDMVSPKKSEDSDQRSYVYFMATANGLIFKNTMGADPKYWVAVSGHEAWRDKSKPSEPLFDLVTIEPRHLLAAGAFGTLLESVNNGETWRSIGKELDNLDAAHFYRIVKTSKAQQQNYGVYAMVIGEFGQAFLLKKVKSTPEFQWEKVQLPIESTLFDGHYLSKRWLIFVGVQGALVAYDLETRESYAARACKKVSLLSVAADAADRNLVIAAGQGMFMRLSILDDAVSGPPHLTCQFLQETLGSLTALAIREDTLFISTEEHMVVKEAASFLRRFSNPADIRWQR